MMFILDTNVIQELRVLFLDQNGADLRNRIAHGLMSHDHFFHHASIYAWWFIFHVLFGGGSRKTTSHQRTLPVRARRTSRLTNESRMVGCMIAQAPPP